MTPFNSSSNLHSVGVPHGVGSSDICRKFNVKETIPDSNNSDIHRKFNMNKTFSDSSNNSAYETPVFHAEDTNISNDKQPNDRINDSTTQKNPTSDNNSVYEEIVSHLKLLGVTARMTVLRKMILPPLRQQLPL